MKTIRRGTFETNSSSTHSLVIDTFYSGIDELKRGTEIFCGEFGWEWNKFHDSYTKFSYLWTIAQGNKGLKKTLQYIAKEDGLILVEPASNEFVYVDHGSEHLERMIKKVSSRKEVREFIYNNSHWIIMGNDNVRGPIDGCFTPNQLENSPYYVVLEGFDFKYPMIDKKELPDALYDLFRRKCDQDDLGGTDSWPRIEEIDEKNNQLIVSFYHYHQGKSIIDQSKTLYWNFELKERKKNMSKNNKTIRLGTFETNSSSTHSFTINIPNGKKGKTLTMALRKTNDNGAEIDIRTADCDEPADPFTKICLLARYTAIKNGESGLHNLENILSEDAGFPVGLVNTKEYLEQGESYRSRPETGNEDENEDDEDEDDESMRDEIKDTFSGLIYVCGESYEDEFISNMEKLLSDKNLLLQWVFTDGGYSIEAYSDNC